MFGLDQDDDSSVSFDSNEQDFIENVSWDTESDDSDLNLDDENLKAFSDYKDA